MNDERMKILQMLENGKITAEQAVALLEALNASSSKGDDKDTFDFSEVFSPNFKFEKLMSKLEKIGAKLEKRFEKLGEEIEAVLRDNLRDKEKSNKDDSTQKSNPEAEVKVDE